MLTSRLKLSIDVVGDRGGDMDVHRGEGMDVDVSWLYWILCTAKVLV